MKDKGASGKVYFIESDDLIKIGVTSRHVSKRLSEINNDSPRGAELITTVKPENGAVGKLEKLLHSYYSIHKERGEWYDVPKREIAGFILYDSIDVEDLREIVVNRTFDEVVEEDEVPLTAKLQEV